jgi:hypothetical protein
MIITLCFNLNGGYVGHIRRFLPASTKYSLISEDYAG